MKTLDQALDGMGARELLDLKVDCLRSISQGAEAFHFQIRLPLLVTADQFRTFTEPPQQYQEFTELTGVLMDAIDKRLTLRGLDGKTKD